MSSTDANGSGLLVAFILGGSHVWTASRPPRLLAAIPGLTRTYSRRRPWWSQQIAWPSRLRGAPLRGAAGEFDAEAPGRRGTRAVEVPAKTKARRRLGAVRGG